jgi:hypothetical protein
MCLNNTYGSVIFLLKTRRAIDSRMFVRLTKTEQSIQKEEFINSKHLSIKIDLLLATV